MSLKVRVIATLLWNGQTLVKGVGFDAWRPVGYPLQAINVFQMREVDEIIFLDITATKEGRRPNFALIESLARECFVPLTVGGGVKSVDDVCDLLRAGADKVSIHTHKGVMPDAALAFGNQALVCCVEDRDNWAWPNGAGELLYQAVSRDGLMQGYNFDLPHVPIPIIASGGCGTYEHMYQAIQAGASAVAAGAMWLFTEQTPLEAKKYLATKGVPVRL